MNPSSSHPHHHHQHHQHLNQSSGGGSGPYLQGPPQPGGPLPKGGGGVRGTGGNGMPYMEESGGAGSGGQQNVLSMSQLGHSGGHPMSIQPPPGWKPHVNPPHHHQHPMSGNGSCSPSSISSNYGASHNYLQQSFYTAPPPDPRGANDGSIGHPGQNPVNYSPVHNSPSPSPYYSPDPQQQQQQRGSADYYHQQHPHPQFNSFDPKNRRGVGGGLCPNEQTVPNHSNFYPGGTSTNNNTFFSIPQQHSNHNLNNSHHHHHHYPPEFPPEYSRMNYTGGGGGGNKNNNTSAGDYFTGPASTRPSSSCPSYGHHHVSTPLEFHQHHLQSQQSFRRNSIESFSSDPGSEGSFNPKYGYSNGNSNVAPARNNANLHLIKRESVIPPPSWSAEHPPPCQDQQESDQYFFPAGTPQYHRPPQSSSVHRCESVPQGHQIQHPPSCSFDDGMSGVDHYKKVTTGMKPRSQSVSYSRNYESHPFRTGGSHYQQQQQQPIPATSVHPNKEVPVSSVDLPSQGQSFGSESGRTQSGSFSDPTTAMMEPHPSEGECDEEEEEEDEDGGMESDSSSSCPSQKSSFTPVSGEDPNQSEDNISDIEEELKKEIQSVTTTTGGGTTGGDPGEHGPDDSNDRELNTGPPSSQPPLSLGDPNKLNIDETDLSNNSLTLFDSIALNTFDSPAPGDGGTAGGGGGSDIEEVDNQLTPNEGGLVEDLDDQEDSLSGLSSISSHQQPRIHHLRRSQSTSSGEPKRSRSASPPPQKIMKRSFSDAYKGLVMNTTAITTALLEYSSREIKVPKGWRREISLLSNLNSSFVFYISPSDTKLRTLEEVKNYITSDGTCKCGLSCPLRLELTFNFDPKVSNSCEEEIESGPLGEGTRRSCCNHQKRKIPLSEDSPLISSTRDDLGDSGDGEQSNGSGGAKKRRTDSSLKGTTTTTIKTSTGTTTLGVPIKEETQSSSSSLIVIPKSKSVTPSSTPVPFAQQSPDTTTRTPQRDMSPASSVSSDTSSVTLSSRSTNSTPTPVGNKTSPNTGGAVQDSKGQGGAEFAWPVPPMTTPLVRPQTPPSGSSCWTPTTTLTAKKSKNTYQHHLISKGPSKRSSSPCPNIDVRQIPLEQNQPPPHRQGPTISPISISISSPGASQLVQSPSVSLVPILRTPATASSIGDVQSGVPPLNTGYSISPVIPNQSSVANTLQFTSILPSTSYCQDFIGGMGMPRLVNSTTPILSTGIQPQQALPTSITISVVGQQGTTASPDALVQPNARTSSSENATETSSEKSPLDLVQDVVDRVHTEGLPDKTTPPMASAPEVTTNPKEITVSETVDSQSSLESKIMKIIADAASASGKPLPLTPTESLKIQNQPQAQAQASSVLLKSEVGKNPVGIRCGVNLSMLPVSSVPMSLPLISSHQMSIQSLPQTIFTSNATTITTTSNSNPNNLPTMMTSNSILNCTPGNPLGVNSPNNAGLSLNNGNQLILQQPPDPNNSSLRYPIFQTLQPIFLNPGGGGGGLLIPNGNDPQSFIQIDQNNQSHGGGDLLHQTMVLDPGSMSMCGTGNILGPGPKKKKKRLSKKQQQQQAQLQLQQQILLQQLFNHQQVQQQHVQAAQQQIPLLLPPSFNLGPQGFLQPMNMNMNMNFFPTSTILTLPNLILNPADGTLFIQQAGPQIPSAPPQTAQIQTPMKIGGVPIQGGAQGQGINTNILLPSRKETATLATSSSSTSTGAPLLVTSVDGGKSGELGIDDSSRQNATPDSSTNDCQLGLVPSTPVPPPQTSTTGAPAPMTVSLPLGSSTNLQGSKKAPLKSKVVSSSTATTVHKRILPQKQILPKIDSTTPSVENNN